MVEDQVVSLMTNLTAVGITTSTAISASRAQGVLRRQKYSKEIETVATTFLEELERATEEENNQLDTKELEGVTDDWQAVAQLLVGEDSDGKIRDIEQIDLVFDSEEVAVEQIAEAIAAVEGYSIADTPELEKALKGALTRAYTRAITDFEKRIAGTDLADVFQTEINLDIATQVNTLERRLAEQAADIESLLSQPAKEEGFRHITPSSFDLGPDPRPEKSWRIGFTLSDVRAGIPAERLGRQGDQLASEELFEKLAESKNCIVVGGPGSGKSTLCKQVAIRWYDDEDMGPVLYRESGTGGGSRFQSVEALKQAIMTTETHTLVVVEDAVQPEANAVFEVMEYLSGYDSVTFLLSGLRVEVEEFDGSGPAESSMRPRQVELVDLLARYHMPRLSKGDIKRVIAAFERATGRSVETNPTEIRQELSTRSDIGIGDMILLSFLLPIGGAEEATTGLERNVRNRYKTLNPDSKRAIRDLRNVHEELLADVGVMVTLLNASGIGIIPELVHSLGAEYGHDWETHDEIEEIRIALEGWFLYSARGESGDGVIRTTHRLWATLYLRELALDNESKQQRSRRRRRSDRRFARCLKSLFALFDDPAQREALLGEFPDSEIVRQIDENPTQMLTEYIPNIFEIGESWPALASLYGTTQSARYEFPSSCPEDVQLRAIEFRGHTQRLRGNYERARNEYQRLLRIADDDESHLKARVHNHLGLVAEANGDLDEASDRFEQSLAEFGELKDARGKAMCLSNLGITARKQGDLMESQRYHEQSLDLFRDVGGQSIEAACLGNLGIIAQSRGEFAEANRYLRRSLDISRDIGNRHAKAESLIGLGLLARHEGRFETATEYTERAFKIERESGNRHGVSKALGIRGLVAMNQDEFEAAREYYKRALELTREISDEYGEATLLSELAILNRKENNLRAAREKMERSLNVFRQFDDQHAIAECTGIEGSIDILFGDIEIGRGKLDEATSLLESADALLTEIRVLRHHIEVERELANDEQVTLLYDRIKNRIDMGELDLGYEQELIKNIYMDTVY